MSDFNMLLIKLLLVLITAPAWWPFLRAVWEEFNEAMADEGGLFGRIPSAHELVDIERERQGKQESLVHEPWPTDQEREAGRRQMSSPGRESSAQGGRPAGPGRPRSSSPARSGFR